MQHDLSRREFLGLAAVSGAFTLGDAQAALASTSKKPAEWTIGCFERPWRRWPYDEVLRGIKSAGYQVTGCLGNHKDEPFVAPEADRDYLHRLKERIAAHGLSINLAPLQTNHDLALDESIRLACKQVDNATILGVPFMMTMGVNKPDRYQHFYRVMAEVAAYAEDQKIQIVLKPHGGCSASADEILRCIDRIDQPNFRVWYDAGNIVHYTGKDPVDDVERVAPLVTGFCAKDCARRGGGVMIQFGTGKVDFHGVLAKLKDAGFAGPVMVECCAGQTQQEVTTNAATNRKFIEEIITSL